MPGFWSETTISGEPLTCFVRVAPRNSKRHGEFWHINGTRPFFPLCSMSESHLEPAGLALGLDNKTLSSTSPLICLLWSNWPGLMGRRQGESSMWFHAPGSQRPHETSFCHHTVTIFMFIWGSWSSMFLLCSLWTYWMAMGEYVSFWTEGEVRDLRVSVSAARHCTATAPVFC